MSQTFYWTAKRFENDTPQETRYFASRQERDAFVAHHTQWKKRGKICTENLEKHLRQNELQQEQSKKMEEKR